MPEKAEELKKLIGSAAQAECSIQTNKICESKEKAKGAGISIIKLGNYNW